MACADCFRGSLNRDEKPTGSITTIHGLHTYIAQPQSSPKGLVVIIPDAFGWDTPNIRVLADRYSQGGDLLVYVPDFMKGTLIVLKTSTRRLLTYNSSGHACPTSAMYAMESVMTPASWFDTIFKKPLAILKVMSGFVPFLFFNRISVSKPIVFDFFRQLRTSPDTSSLKVGVAGFCWGGKHVINLCHDYPSSRVHRAGSESGQLQSLIDAGFTAHPSMLNVPEDIDNVRIPLSIAIGETDMAMKSEQIQQTKTILEKKKDGDHELNIIPGAIHGFAVRGLLSDPKQKEHSDIAEQQAIAWFGKFLA